MTLKKCCGSILSLQQFPTIGGLNMANVWNGAQPRLVITRTPLRVSFAGGGTDLAAFYEYDYGAVLSTAINQYIYVTVKRHGEVFNEPIRVNYSKSEQVNELMTSKTISCVVPAILEIDPPIYISTVGDLPASAALAGRVVSPSASSMPCTRFATSGYQRAVWPKEASHIEIDVLRSQLANKISMPRLSGGLNFSASNPVAVSR
jgi:D-glycero-alpha-D-manno-heptose-7-phosphate kinase